MRPIGFCVPRSVRSVLRDSMGGWGGASIAEVYQPPLSPPRSHEENQKPLIYRINEGLTTNANNANETQAGMAMRSGVSEIDQPDRGPLGRQTSFVCSKCTSSL
jgi:hypothetical protein